MSTNGCCPPRWWPGCRSGMVSVHRSRGVRGRRKARRRGPGTEESKAKAHGGLDAGRARGRRWRSGRSSQPWAASPGTEVAIEGAQASPGTQPAQGRRRASPRDVCAPGRAETHSSQPRDGGKTYAPGRGNKARGKCASPAERKLSFRMLIDDRYRSDFSCHLIEIPNAFEGFGEVSFMGTM